MRKRSGGETVQIFFTIAFVISFIWGASICYKKKFVQTLYPGREIVITGALAILIGAEILIVSVFMLYILTIGLPVDSCLDSGGSYNYYFLRCEH